VIPVQKDIQTYATDQWTEENQKTNGEAKPKAKRAIPADSSTAPGESASKKK
jgi:hypothetical protein